MSEAIRVLDHFYSNEINCRCGKCEFDVMKFDFVSLVALKKLRDILNAPVRVIRGYSCFPHHESIYKNLKQPVTLKSAHLCTSDHRCCGFDISVDRPIQEIIPKAICLGFSGIGFGSGKLHLDTMPRFSIWEYQKDGSIRYVV